MKNKLKISDVEDFKDDFPCVDCITFTICRNQVLQKILDYDYYDIKNKDKDTLYRLTYFFSWKTLSSKCDLLREHLHKEYSDYLTETNQKNKKDWKPSSFVTVLTPPYVSMEKIVYSEFPHFEGSRIDKYFKIISSVLGK